MNAEEFRLDYCDSMKEDCNNIENVINSIVRKALESIWRSIDCIIDDVKSGKFSNEEIADKLKELQEEL